MQSVFCRGCGFVSGGWLVLALVASTAAQAQRQSDAVAVFSALDKVTARISRIEIPINTTHRFGSLQVTPRVCFSRPPTEKPKTTSFVEVDEIGLDGQESQLFSGWMFAESPGLNAVEHPVFDVWLIDCEGRSRTASDGGAGSTTPDEAAAQPAREEPPRRRRRVRR